MIRKKNISRLRSTVAIVAVMAAVVAACGSDNGTDSAPPDTVAPTTDAPVETESTEAPAAVDDTTPPATESPLTTEASAEPERPAGTLPPGEYTIGYLASNSGTLAFAGIPSRLAAEALLEEVNSTGALGEGVTLRFKVVDDETDQARAITAAEDLINDDEVVAVLCCSSSSVTGAIREMFIEAQLSMSIISAIMPDAPDGKYIFRGKPPTQTVYETLAPAAQAAFQFENVVITRTSDNDGMVATAEIMGSLLESEGVEVTYVDLLSTDRDQSALATQIIDLDPDGVFLMELASTLPLTLRELYDRGYEGPMFGTASMSNRELFDIAGDAIVGRPFSDTYFLRGTSPVMQEFLDVAGPSFDNNEPNSYGAEGYAAFQLLIEGMRKAAEIYGEITRESVAAGLAAVTRVTTPTGEITMGPDGQGEVDETYLLQWTADGEVVAWDGTVEGIETP